MRIRRLNEATAATRDRLRPAFPESIRSTVDRAVDTIPGPPGPALIPAGRVGPLVVDGEDVLIPYRIYSRERRRWVAARLDVEAALVLGCAYTRHHDGRVRERSVLTVVEVDRAWIVPFVVQLLGEYVVQIGEVVLQRLDRLQPETYQRFAAANDSFMRLTRSHIVSYWNCYYRGHFRLPDYPPVRVLMELGLWKGREGRRALAGVSETGS
jgi:hypothetical protein